MKTETLTRKQQQIKDLTEFANELKNNGFTVLVSAKHPFEWLYFYKDGQFGDVNADYFGGFNFSTVHKPCRECGTGFSIERETELTIENANKALVFAPNWASGNDIKAIRKYTTIEDFTNSSNNKWAEYYIF